jgi:proteic killer suppression protein
MIKTFATKPTAALFAGYVVKKLPPAIQQRARERLVMLDSVTILEELLVPPSNRLESLKGNRKGQYSIRVNEQWRICFVWKDGDAYDVEIVDYH